MSRSRRSRAAGGARSLKRRPAAPRVPRRVSGPARRPRVATRAARRWPARPPRLAPRCPTRRLLDRLIRGRAWVAVVAVVLIGIVAMQVRMLELNAGIGRAVEGPRRSSTRTPGCACEVSRLRSGERIQRVGRAARDGHAQRRRGPLPAASGDARDARGAVTTRGASPSPRRRQLASADPQTALTTAPVTTTRPDRAQRGSHADPAPDPGRAAAPRRTPADAGTGTAAPGTGTTTTTTTHQPSSSSPRHRPARRPPPAAAWRRPPRRLDPVRPDRAAHRPAVRGLPRPARVAALRAAWFGSCARPR